MRRQEAGVNRVAVGLGSNLQPEANIEKAKALLASEFRVLKASEFRKTKPVNAPDHPDFINGVLLLETSLSRPALKERLHGIEESLGRPRKGDRSAPRTIDLDILVWNGEIIDPDYHSCDFLQKAVAEVLPELTFHRPK